MKYEWHRAPSLIHFVVGLNRTASRTGNYSATQGGVAVAKLAPPVYPPLARQTGIAGDVQLELVVRADGSIEAASVTSGHPLLKQAALDSVQHSQFECRDCDKEPQPYQMIYSFQLGPAVYCTDSSTPTKEDEQEERYHHLNCGAETKTINPT